jgi:signal transduction histidine kinase/CheY-like chemotaxis protein
MLKQRSMRALLPLAFGFVVLIASAAVTIWLSTRQQAAVAWVRHTLEVESRINRVRSLVTDAESGQRGYLLTGQSAYLEPYQTATARIPIELETLREQTADNLKQRRNFLLLRANLQQKLSLLSGSVALAQLGRGSEAVAVVRTDKGRRYMAEVRFILSRMIAEEDRLLEDRVADLGWFNTASRVALLLSAFLVISLAYFAVRDASRRLAAIDEGQQRLTEEVQERRSAQSQVVQLQKMEAVGQLTGGIAHDFNNMLAVIICSLDIARRRLASAEPLTASKYIDSAVEGAELAASLTASLLAFARRQPLEPKVLDLNALVSGMAKMLRRTLGERVEIETVLAGGIWQVRADGAQIESALINLAVNARDAMDGGGKLIIETGNCELDERYAADHDEVTPGQYVMLSVTDTGTGMSQELIDRVFEPFFTTKEVGHGTGLGLSQVFGFLKQSAGHVKIYSEVGVGTTIKLYLPRHLGSLVVDSAKLTNIEMQRARVEEIVLVVEDRAQVRRTTASALQELGYHVIEAADGDEALQQLATNLRIDMLFTDIMMPGMTGRQLADRATADRPNLKVLYTTGYTRNAIVHNGIVDYGVSFLAKPFSIEALARKVREVLDR